MIRKINLAGTWGFRADEEKKGIENNYQDIPPKDDIILPATTSQNKKGKKNKKRETGYLTDDYFYEGYAWFYKTVDLSGVPEDSRIELFLERTRLTKVWVNRKYVGDYDSLCTPHIFDISDYVNNGENEICIMVNNTDYPTRGGHLTSPDTQSNWNGVTGDIQLIVSEKTRIKSVKAYPDIDKKSVKLKFDLEGVTEADIDIYGFSEERKSVDTQTVHITAENPEAEIVLGEDISLWSEYTPYSYNLTARILGTADVCTFSFGMRKIETEGLDFKLNGEKIYLRGRHDGMIFPITGAAPTTLNDWIEYLSKVKQWGFNHVRFHTCCPPEVAFVAADNLGIYMQPELPFWGTIYAPNEENYNETEQLYLIEEGRRILNTFGNHPSFVMMSLGNELWGSPQELNRILKEYHEIDNRHLYTQGSNNFQFFPNIQPYDDFFSGVRLSKDRLIRGSYGACDKPYGFVQSDRPNTSHSYDKLIFPENQEVQNSDNCEEIEIQYGTGVKKVKVGETSDGLLPDKPIVTHEIGQYCSYPDFDEIPEYSGVLKPYNIETFRFRLSEKNMLSYADDFHIASGMLAFNCYKLEIEAVMRSEYISGFQLLDLQDFTGQGTALVGMLNGLMQEKKFVRENNLLENWQGFCSDVAILAEIDNFIITSGETVKIPVWLRYMRPEKLVGKRLTWATEEANGQIVIPDGFKGLGKIGEINFTADYNGTDSLILRIDGIRPETDKLPQTVYNSYDLNVFPKAEEHFEIPKKQNSVNITSDPDNAKQLLENGEKVLYLPNELPESIEGFYCTDFWCYPMFRSISESMGKEIPVGTLGLLINKNHPAFEKFPTEFYSTPIWYNIVTHSDCAVLDNTPEDYRPIVQTIDNFERNHKLGNLYEAKCGNGKLMVCTSRLSEIKELPEVQAFIKSLLEYMDSDNFNPTHEFNFKQLGLE